MSQIPSNSGTTVRNESLFNIVETVPCLLVAHAAEGSVRVDRCILHTPFIVGRSDGCDLPILDDRISKRHFVIAKEEDSFFIEDQNSTNGTYLNGDRIYLKQRLHEGDVIRLGRALLLFHFNAGAVLNPSRPPQFGIVGPFHAAALIDQLIETAHSARHVLLSGPSGAGKDLAARALAALYSDNDTALPFLAHNAAHFSSDEEAASTLFGVAPRVFSSVDARPGLIERARNGVLFLDEIHNLPERVQRSLLRTIEDGWYARIGEGVQRSTSVRFVFASNHPAPTFGLARDLLARLRTVHVAPLLERTADIPHIFNQVLARVLQEKNISQDAVMPLIDADHIEAMCLDGFPEDNVRGVIDIADRIAAKICAGISPSTAVRAVFFERFAGGPLAGRYGKTPRLPEACPSYLPDEAASSSRYEAHKQEIVSAYLECRGNLSATERMLKQRDIPCTRRWLSFFVKKWDVTAASKGKSRGK